MEVDLAVYVVVTVCAVHSVSSQIPASKEVATMFLCILVLLFLPLVVPTIHTFVPQATPINARE
jgi:hypothetical protein